MVATALDDNARRDWAENEAIIKRLPAWKA